MGRSGDGGSDGGQRRPIIEFLREDYEEREGEKRKKK